MNDPAPPPHSAAVSITLYAQDGPRSLALADLAKASPSDSELLWVDLSAPSNEEVGAVWRALKLGSDARPSLPIATMPYLRKSKDYFLARVLSAVAEPGLSFRGAVLTIVAGRNFVVTHHTEDVGFLSALKATEADALCDVGCLGEASFVAALLDWHLSTYFAATASFELEIERLENRILSDTPPGRLALPQLCSLRRAASRLRRMLAPHRVVFDGLSRPDFVPSGEDDVTRHLHELDDRFERAMEVVENARELVVGSFQLFSTQTELQTNERMKLLTFVTVVTGLLAVVAGALGMNFEANFFGAKTVGFWVAVAFMVFLGLTSVVVGRWKKWL